MIDSTNLNTSLTICSTILVDGNGILVVVLSCGDSDKSGGTDDVVVIMVKVLSD